MTAIFLYLYAINKVYKIRMKLCVESCKIVILASKKYGIFFSLMVHICKIR